jgi:hypothetical protein
MLALMLKIRLNVIKEAVFKNTEMICFSKSSFLLIISTHTVFPKNTRAITLFMIINSFIAFFVLHEHQIFAHSSRLVDHLPLIQSH